MVQSNIKIEFTAVSCERDYRTLFSPVDFVINSGDVVQLRGPNGAGKTTLLRALVGLNQALIGQISFNGEVISSRRDEFDEQLLYIGHKAGIKKVLSPLENLTWLTGRSSTDPVLWQALDQVGLYGFEETPCAHLSAGQNRRVMLARLYAQNKSIWVLDEPFTAIDLEGVAQIEQLLSEHAAAGGIVLMTTHHKVSSAIKVREVFLELPESEVFADD